MPPNQPTAQHPLKDFEPLVTRGMLKHISPEQKDKYAQMLKEDGNKLFKEKKFKEAISFYSAAVAFKEDAVFYSNRSACYAGLKDYHKVIEDTTAALDLNPDFMKCMVRRAAAYEKVEKYEEAMFDWLRASLLENGNAQTSPAFNSFKATLDVALTTSVQEMERQRGSQLPAADHIFEFIGGLDQELTAEGLPEDPSKLKPDSGDFYLISGMKKMYVKDSTRYIEADKLFSKALSAYLKETKADPGNAVLTRKLGIAHEYVSLFKALKDDPTSTVDSKKSIELNPKRARSFTVYGYLLSQRGIYKEAEELLKKALALAPKSGEVNFCMGGLYEKRYLKSNSSSEADKAYDFYKKSKLYRPQNVYALVRAMNMALSVNDLDGFKKMEAFGAERFGRSPEYANFNGELMRDANDWTGAMSQFQLGVVLGDIAHGASLRATLISNAVGMLLSYSESNEQDLDISAAKELLEKALKIDPRSDVCKLALGHLKIKEGKDDEAIALYKEAASLSPTHETRIIVTAHAFTQSIESKLKKVPSLQKAFESLNMGGTLPSLAMSGFMDMMNGNCPCGLIHT